MLEDPLTGGSGAGAGLLNTSMKSEGGLSGKGDYGGDDETGVADRTFDQPEPVTGIEGDGIQLNPTICILPSVIIKHADLSTSIQYP